MHFDHPEGTASSSTRSKMMSFAPQPQLPIFSNTWADNRPAVPSPLSSSPVRASSPLSPIDRNALFQRETQSSPIQQPKFKFASRQTRPNPLVKKREEAQEAKRNNFLSNVRRKAEEKAWQRRDIEGSYLKKSWLSDMKQLARDAPTLDEADIEDAATTQQPFDQDDIMSDDIPDDIPGDDDLEAMVASYEQEQGQSQRPPSFVASDDEYDDLFDELMTSQDQPPVFSQPDQMEM